MWALYAYCCPPCNSLYNPDYISPSLFPSLSHSAVHLHVLLLSYSAQPVHVDGSCLVSGSAPCFYSSRGVFFFLPSILHHHHHTCEQINQANQVKTGICNDTLVSLCLVINAIASSFSSIYSQGHKNSTAEANAPFKIEGLMPMYFKVME